MCSVYLLNTFLPFQFILSVHPFPDLAGRTDRPLVEENSPFTKQEAKLKEELGYVNQHLEGSFQRSESVKQKFASQAQEMGNTFKDLEEVHRRELETCDDEEHQAALADDKPTFLENKLLQQAVVEFKANRYLSVVVEKFLCHKIIKFYDDFSAHAQVVDHSFPWIRWRLCRTSLGGRKDRLRGTLPRLLLRTSQAQTTIPTSLLVPYFRLIRLFLRIAFSFSCICIFFIFSVILLYHFFPINTCGY